MWMIQSLEARGVGTAAKPPLRGIYQRSFIGERSWVKFGKTEFWSVKRLRWNSASPKQAVVVVRPETSVIFATDGSMIPSCLSSQSHQCSERLTPHLHCGSPSSYPPFTPGYISAWKPKRDFW